jgi:hypothetical protein
MTGFAGGLRVLSRQAQEPIPTETLRARQRERIMKRIQVVRRLAHGALVTLAMLGGAAASHAFTTPAVTLDINVPHNSPDHGAHNLVTFAVSGSDFIAQTATVTISGAGIPQPKPFIVKLGVPTSVSLSGGQGGVGYVNGKLNLINAGTFYVVTFSGRFNGWAGYDFQSHVSLTDSEPLTVGATDGK